MTIKKYGTGIGAGWHLESERHSLARRGIKTGRKGYETIGYAKGNVPDAVKKEFEHKLIEKRKKLRESLLKNDINIDKKVNFWGKSMTLGEAIDNMDVDDINDAYKMIQDKDLPSRFAKKPQEMPVDPSIFKFGSVEWQGAMLSNIEYKNKHKIPLEDHEIVFLNLQKEHSTKYAKLSHTAKALESLPTLAVGQADDLKIDTGDTRVWVSRVDGSISTEKLKDGKWVLVDDEDIDYAGDIHSHPQFLGNAPLSDLDRDSVPDRFDWDIDGDGTPNWEDDEGVFDFLQTTGGDQLFNILPNRTKDSDFDGIPDYKDLHPLNPTKGIEWSGINKNFPVRNLLASSGELEAISRGVAPEVYTYVYRTSKVPVGHQRQAKELLKRRKK